MTRYVAPALLVATTLPAFVRPWRITAWSGGEADNHLWMHWQAAHPGTVWSNVPVGTPLPLMDPVNLPWFALGFAVSPAVAWNLAWLANVALALLGGAWLGREVAGRSGALAAMTAVGCCPFLMGMGSFGITEAWPLGWLAVFGAAAVRFARDGGAWWLAAGAALGAFALSGWYNAVFAVIAAPSLAAYALSRAGWRRWPGLAAAGALGAIPALARLPSWLAAREAWSHRLDPGVPAPDPDWYLGPDGGGADLLSPFLPVPLWDASARPVYLGAVVLVLAARGRGWTLWVGAAALVALGLGRWLEVAGHAVLPGPASLVAIGPLDGLTHWYRALGPALVVLAPLVAEGAARWWRWWIPLAIFADFRLFGTTPWPAEQYDPGVPEALASLDGTGALVLLPFDNGRPEFAEGVPRTYERWAPWLGRPIAEHYDGPDAALWRSRFLASLDAACGVPPEIPRDWRHPWPDAPITEPVAISGRRALLGWGVDHVVLVRDRAPRDCAPAITRWLGPADVDGPIAAWRVQP